MSDNKSAGETNPAFGSGVTPESDNSQTQAPEPASLSPEEMERILKRDAHAQAHIERLEAEAREREEMLASLQKQVEEYNAMVEEQRKVDEFQRARVNAAEESSGQTTAAVDADAIVEQVQARLAQEQAKQIAQRNYEETVRWANEVYGKEFEQRVAERSQALGMTVEDAISLASKSPEAFKNLYAPKGSAAPASSGNGGMNSLGVYQEASTNARADSFLNEYRQKGFRALGTREAFEAFKKQ